MNDQRDDTRSLAIRRVIAACVLVGFAVGAVIAYASGERFTVGGLWGGIAGAVVGAVGGALWHRRRPD